jgi:hypothetical protein
VTALGARTANPINFEIEFENIILVALRVFEFLHSLETLRDILHQHKISVANGA